MSHLASPTEGRRSSQEPVVSECVITDGAWHRIGLVWDGAYRSLYVDDTLVAADATVQLDLPIEDIVFNIGAGKNLESGSFWSGLIDDVRIYNRVVTP